MFSLFPFLDKQQHRRDEFMRSTAGPAVPWTPDIKWKPVLHIDAVSYQHYVTDLFPELPPSYTHRRPAQGGTGKLCMYSPRERYCYTKRVLPKNALLSTAYGNRRGYVFFNGDVVIPTLFENALVTAGTTSRG